MGCCQGKERDDVTLPKREDQFTFGEQNQQVSRQEIEKAQDNLDKNELKLKFKEEFHSELVETKPETKSEENFVEQKNLDCLSRDKNDSTFKGTSRVNYTSENENANRDTKETMTIEQLEDKKQIVNDRIQKIKDRLNVNQTNTETVNDNSGPIKLSQNILNRANIFQQRNKT